LCVWSSYFVLISRAQKVNKQSMYSSKYGREDIYRKKNHLFFFFFNAAFIKTKKQNSIQYIYSFFCFRRRNIIKKIHNFSHTNRIIFIISKVFFLHTAFDIISCWHFSVGFVYIFIWKKSSRKKFVSFVANLVEVFFLNQS